MARFFLSPSILQVPPNYTVFRRDRKFRGRFGGGVLIGLIAVRDSIKASPKEDVLCDSELIFIDLLFPDNRKITLGAFYRPPNNDTKPLEELQQALDTLSTSELIMVGDFNLPDVDWLNIRASNNSTNYELLFDAMQDNFLSQLVVEPNTDQNILDLVLATLTNIVQDLMVGELLRPQFNNLL